MKKKDKKSKRGKKATKDTKKKETNHNKERGFCNKVAYLIGFYWKKLRLRTPWVLLGISISYFIFYFIYLFNTPLYRFLYIHDYAFKLLFQIAFAVFGTGILGAVFKYLQFNGLISEEFNKVIDSSKFEEKLAKQLSSIVLSDDFLEKRKDIDDIWKRITLIKYHQHLPGLGDKLDKVIVNKFFHVKGLAYYYKNFQRVIQITLLADNKRVKIVDSASFTIKREDSTKFTWDSSIRVDSLYTDRNTISYEFEVENIHYKSTDKDITYSLKKRENKTDLETCKAQKELSGHEEYYFTVKGEVEQDLDSDRMFNLSTDRIIDDISILILLDDKLSIVTAPVNGVKLYDNGAYNSFTHAYVNREVLLTGEYLKIFIYKNDAIK